jgi:hypothetical protein
MGFNELLADFAKRHNVENLVVVDGAASLDIDGIIVTIVANDETLTLSAEFASREERHGERPAFTCARGMRSERSTVKCIRRWR